MPFKIILLLSLMSLSACVSIPEPLSNRNSPLTQGNVQMNIRTGVTTKAQILSTFGAPNVTTRDGEGKEVWTYQRQAQVEQQYSRDGGWGVWAIVAFAGDKTRAAGFETSSRMMTLIIKFDSNDVVSDFDSRASNF